VAERVDPIGGGECLVESGGAIVRIRPREALARPRDRALRPGEPRGDRGLLAAEERRNVGRWYAAHDPQGKGDLLLRREQGVARDENETESVVDLGLVAPLVGIRALLGIGLDQQGQLRVQHPFSAKHIDRDSPRGRGGPRPNVVDALAAGETFRGPGEGFLRALLGEIQVAERAKSGPDDARPLLGERLLETHEPILVAPRPAPVIARPTRSLTPARRR